MSQLFGYEIESLDTLVSEEKGTSISVVSARCCGHAENIAYKRGCRVAEKEVAELRSKTCHYIQEARRWMSLYDLAMSEVSGYEEEVCNLTERLAVMEKSCTQ
jgi:hypothetical protein